MDLLCQCCTGREKFDDPEVSDVSDSEVEPYSEIVKAGVRFLKQKHKNHRKESWNLTHGKVVGIVHQTPKRKYWGCQEVTPAGTHDDDFPDKMFEVITSAQRWVDITSLSPPDGKFADKFAEAMCKLDANARSAETTITVRMLFGNIIGMPVDDGAVIKALTAKLPKDPKIQLWVGSYRIGTSWNHSKIIAVDGKHLFTGGHNLWDAHYLQKDPVHDISMEITGDAAHDGHIFAERMWQFIIDHEEGFDVVNMLHVPEWVPMPVCFRVSLDRFPPSIKKYPPPYRLPRQNPDFPSGGMRMLSMGRLGSIHPNTETADPSDTAIFKMLASAQTIIRMSLQDLGPLTLPVEGENISIPGGVWPENYLYALGSGIYDRGVDVEIVLSNPHAVPGGLNPMTANYGNGWSCVDVASEIIKAIQKARPEAEDTKLRAMVNDNLRITFLRSNKDFSGWPGSAAIGNHAKFFMIDDICYYIGSQNLYIANLAEWGVLIDDKAQTQKILEEYWNPMWAQSFRGSDVDVDEVMNSLGVNRNGEDPKHAGLKTRVLAAQAQRAAFKVNHESDYHKHSAEEHAGLHQVDEETAKEHLKASPTNGNKK